MANPITLRLPAHLQASPAEYTPPTIEWLTGSWHVTHSSLPLWRGKRNVVITYTATAASGSGRARLDDVVAYQTAGSAERKTVAGVDTASPDAPGAWHWRGKGWLRIASSRWQLLGHGELPDGGRWAVTYFAKTLFTPAGVDLYARERAGLPPDAVERVKLALAGLDHPEMRKLAAALFEVTIDSTASAE
jgi:hypothetical protein